MLDHDIVRTFTVAEPDADLSDAFRQRLRDRLLDDLAPVFDAPPHTMTDARLPDPDRIPMFDQDVITLMPDDAPPSPQRRRPLVALRVAAAVAILAAAATFALTRHNTHGKVTPATTTPPATTRATTATTQSATSVASTLPPTSLPSTTSSIVNTLSTPPAIPAPKPTASTGPRPPIVEPTSPSYPPTSNAPHDVVDLSGVDLTPPDQPDRSAQLLPALPKDSSLCRQCAGAVGPDGTTVALSGGVLAWSGPRGTGSASLESVKLTNVDVIGLIAGPDGIAYVATGPPSGDTRAVTISALMLNDDNTMRVVRSRVMSYRGEEELALGANGPIWVGLWPSTVSSGGAYEDIGMSYVQRDGTPAGLLPEPLVLDASAEPEITIRTVDGSGQVWRIVLPKFEWQVFATLRNAGNDSATALFSDGSHALLVRLTSNGVEARSVPSVVGALTDRGLAVVSRATGGVDYYGFGDAAPPDAPPCRPSDLDVGLGSPGGGGGHNITELILTNQGTTCSLGLRPTKLEGRVDGAWVDLAPGDSTWKPVTPSRGPLAHGERGSLIIEGAWPCENPPVNVDRFRLTLPSGDVLEAAAETYSNCGWEMSDFGGPPQR